MIQDADILFSHSIFNFAEFFFGKYQTKKQELESSFSIIDNRCGLLYEVDVLKLIRIFPSMSGYYFLPFPGKCRFL